MTRTDVPGRDELVRSAAAAGDVLRGRAQWSEDHRRLHEDTIEALAAAGTFRLRTPRRHGGYEADTRTMVEVAAELARAHGSAAWVASVYWIPTWIAGRFPEAVQDEVFAIPDARVCGTLSPGAMSEAVPGGIVVNGKWGFISGAHHAHWQEIISVHVPDEGTPYPVVALVPMSDLLVVDDWDTDALRGTGSVSTVAKDLFVPQERVLPLPQVLEGTGDGSGIHSAPLLPVAAASSVGTAIGLADAAREVFETRLPHRKITYTDYASQREAPVTHLRLAEAVDVAAEAGFHARRLSDLVDGKCGSGEAWKLAERVAARGMLGSAVRRAKQSVDLLAAASGGSSVRRDVPIGRIARDAAAVGLHALMNPDTNAELHGRVLCGLEPNTQYV